MKLYLAQHGEAFAKEKDPSRPLTDKGKADAEKMASFLKHAGVTFERILHSEKLRAQQTAECFANTIAPQITLESSGIINPNDDPKAFAWQDDSWDKDILVVGHLPFMAKLVSHLLIDDENILITAFQPASIVCLEFHGNKVWTINWMITPAIISN